MSDKTTGSGTEKGGSRSLKRLGVFALLGLMIYGVWTIAGLQSRMASMEERTSGEMTEIREAIARIDATGDVGQAGRVPQTFLDDAAKSVYIVTAGEAEGLEAVLATAWVVGDGVLATNAHVASTFDPSGRMSLFVRNPDNESKPHKVIGIRIHAGYQSFPQAVMRAKPFMAGPFGQPMPVLAVPGYDVALLFVDRPGDLAPPLKVASEETIRSMRAGDPLAMVGYPLQIFNNQLQRVSANPRHQRGQITAMTHFVQARVAPEDAVFMIHNVPGIGGNSGSPMLDVNGEVVGLMSHTLGFAGENGAQRADLLLDLVAGNDRKKIISKNMTEWTELFSQFKTGHEVIPEATAKLVDKGQGKIAVDAVTGSVRYRAADNLQLTVCLKGDRPSDEVSRLLEDQRRQRGNSLLAQTSPEKTVLRAGAPVPLQNGGGSQCPELEAVADGIWKIRKVHLDQPGPHLVYAFEYTFMWPCTDLQILAKPVNEANLQYISNPSPLPHVTIDVPEGGGDYHLVFGVNYRDPDANCPVAAPEGAVEFGVAHFRDQDISPLPGQIKISRWLAVMQEKTKSLMSTLREQPVADGK